MNMLRFDKNQLKHTCMGILLILIITNLVAGCMHSDNSPSQKEIQTLASVDLSGTWTMSNEIKKYKVDTGEYLLSTFIEHEYLLDDTDIGVGYAECRRYGGILNYGVKTDDHFYMNTQDNGFALQDDGTLQMESAYTYPWDPEYNYESIQTLTKVSDDIQLDYGTFILNGPIAKEEYAHVCRWTAHSNIGKNRTVAIIAPFGDDDMSFQFNIVDDIAAGAYTYSRFVGNRPFTIDVSSFATEFQSAINSNTLAPDDVSVTFIELTDFRMSGVFSFTGQDEGSYSGEFEIMF